MRVTVLRPFVYGHDGVHGRALAAGDVAEVRDTLVPGLRAEGYVGDAPATVAAPPDTATAGVPDDAAPDPAAAAAANTAALTIPDDWRELSWPERRALAASVSETPIKSADDAEAAIEAELARRQAAALSGAHKRRDIDFPDRFDVVDAEGRKLNDAPLSEADADAMVARLTAAG